jgi:hypothetical protein
MECMGNPIRIGFFDQKAGTIVGGQMVAQRDGSDLLEVPSVRTDLRVLGWVATLNTYVAAADRDQRLQVDTGVGGPFTNSASTDEILYTDVGKLCYVVSGTVVALTGAPSMVGDPTTNTRSPAGFVRYVDTRGVWVDFTHCEQLREERINTALIVGLI